jgi:hypothetical protein
MAKLGVGGSNGPGEKYVHPVYRNMSPGKISAIDKVTAMGINVKGKNKGKASDVAKNMKEVQEDIKSLTRVRGSRTSNTGGSEPKYRGYRGSYSTRQGLSGGAGGAFLENLK